jgi:hypothetical protein
MALDDSLAVNDSAAQARSAAKLTVIAAELATKGRTSMTIDWTLGESALEKSGSS